MRLMKFIFILMNVRYIFLSSHNEKIKIQRKIKLALTNTHTHKGEIGYVASESLSLRSLGFGGKF